MYLLCELFYQCHRKYSQSEYKTKTEKLITKSKGLISSVDKLQNSHRICHKKCMESSKENFYGEHPWMRNYFMKGAVRDDSNDYLRTKQPCGHAILLIFCRTGVFS